MKFISHIVPIAMDLCVECHSRKLEQSSLMDTMGKDLPVVLTTSVDSTMILLGDQRS